MKMLAILSVALLMGCATVPEITTVKRKQEYTMRDSGVVYYQIVPLEQVKDLGCGPAALGCAVGLSTGVVIIYIGDMGSQRAIKHIAEHEFNHVVYGPEHRRR